MILKSISKIFQSQSYPFSRILLLGVALASLSGLFLSCNVTDRNLGDEPIGPKEGLTSKNLDSLTKGNLRDSISGNMRIYATPHSLKAGNGGRSTISVQVFDANNNPLSGKVVRFAASAGTITAQDTTKENGLASATYSALPKNGEIKIIAAATFDTLQIVSTTLQLEGLSVKITSSTMDTSVGDNIPVTIKVTDGEGQALAATEIKLQGTVAATGMTDGAGIFHTTVSSTKDGQVKFIASALGVADTLLLGFWTTPPSARTRSLLLFADPARIAATQNEKSNIKAILYDDKHNPVANKVITFTANHGLITSVDTTNNEGVATAVYSGVAQDLDAIITASYAGTDSIRHASTTITSTGLQFEVKAGRSEALLNDSVPVSIRIRDAAGLPLSDVTVNVVGATQSTVKTNPSGVATTIVTASTEKTISVSAAALGAKDSAKIIFFKTLPLASASNKPAVGNLRIYVDQSKLKASNTDQTTVRVVAFDKFNNPLAGRAVRFSANYGIINSLDSTDAKGEATAIYRSVPINVDAKITASMTVDDSALAVATTVTLAGVEIHVTPSLTDALLNRQVPVLVKLIDGAGNPIPDAKISYNGSPGEGATDGAGTFITALTSGTEKRVTLTASALGATDSGSVDFWKTLPSKNDNSVGTIRKMRIFSSRSQLRADNSDFATISVILTNENNNPATGESIKFTSDLGIIDQIATVDSAGRATVTLHSSPVNGVCHIVATAVGRNLTATTDVLFNGVTLQLASSRTDLKVGEPASLEAFLKDASGNAIGGDQIVFTLTGPGTFDNGGVKYTSLLNPNGRALVRISATASGTVSVKATALNTGDSVNVNFSNNTLSLSATSQALQVGGGDSTLITATFVNGAGAPVAGANISFATNAGSLSSSSATTDGAGKASVYLRSASFAGTATVQANASGGTAQLSVGFNSSSAKSIKLTITADNIAINGGIANLRAVVADADGNMVSGQAVNFRILKGPGGGKNITKPVVNTQAGVSVSQLQSGSLASSYRGTLVVASTGNLSDTSKLTISGTAHLVTVSRPEDDSVKTSGVGIIDESTFEFFVGAVVQDINGNAVADGTEVHFSAVVTGLAVGHRILDHWDGLGSGSNTSVKAIYKTVLLDVPFEDINNNFKYDPGIDLDLDGNNSILRRGEDRNGDGIYDYNTQQYDTWFDFNGNGKCDATVGEDDTVRVAGKLLYADLNGNGIRDTSEVLTDRSGKTSCNLPPSGDYPYHTWEIRSYLPSLNFINNDFAIAIDVSATTKNGVANARLRYPRQFAQRLIVNVNAEANGVRDVDGERFPLPLIK